MTLCCHFLKVIKNNLNPCWRKFSVPLQTFCGGDFNRPIKVQSLEILFVVPSHPFSIDANCELSGCLVILKLLDCFSRTVVWQISDYISVLKH